MTKNTPLLSVIILGYNVEEFIEESINSILEQSYKNLEIILIDDGSTDLTAKIMDRYVALFDNIEVIHKDNGGPSAARNAGIEAATGEYIAFVDGDDLVPANAYHLLMASVEQTNSDLATGAVVRFNSTRNVRSYIHKLAIKDTVYQTSIQEHPELVYDTTSWNKVYRLKLFIENNLRYPVGMLYEDIPVMMAAHLLANHINIITSPVYKWRWREGDNKSITQSRGNNIQHYKDRLKMLKLTRSYMKQYGATQNVEDAFNLKLLATDIPLSMQDIRESEEDYILEFQKMTTLIIRDINPELFKQLSIKNQIQYAALLQGNIKDLKKYSYRRKNIGQIIERKNKYKFVDPNISVDVANAVSIEKSQKFEQRILKVDFDEKTNETTITGWLQLNQLKVTKKLKENFTVKLVNILTDKVMPIAFNRESIKRRRHLFKHSDYRYFKITFNQQQAYQILGNGIWKVQVNYQVKNINVTDFLASPKRKFKSNILSENGYQIKTAFSFDWTLAFNVMPLQISETESKKEFQTNLIQTISVDHDKITISAWLNKPDTTNLISIDKKNNKIISQVIGNKKNVSTHQVIFEFSVHEIINSSSVAQKYLQLVDKQGLNLNYEFSHEKQVQKYEVAQHSLLIQKNMKNKIGLFIASRFSKLIEIQWLNDSQLQLIAENTLFQEKANKIILRVIDQNEQYKYQFDDIEMNSNGKILANINLINEQKDSFIKAAKYSIYLDFYFDNQVIHSQLNVEPELLETFESHTNNLVRTSLTVTNNQFLILNQKLSWDRQDSTKLKRAINFSIYYPLQRLFPLKKKTIVFDSYWGAYFNGNEKAIYDYIQENFPDYECIWLFKDPNTTITGNGQRVRYFSKKYWYYMARAKYFIENTNLPNQYAKRQGQVEVQSLHGTFMKTMGFDEPYFKDGSKGRQNNFLKRIKRWDYLVSPSPYMDKTASHAFNFEKKLITSGFPRNDVLYQKNNETNILQIKKSLKIPLDKKVILYAPTYRNKDGFDFQLNIKQMQDKLSDEYVLLVRLHYFVANKIDLTEFEGFTYDVSNYPTVENLYLIADTLITDYSSVMFDYAHLKRPMIFFAYDLKDYTEDTRGVYLDYRAIVPGPIVDTTDKIIAELSDFNQLQTTYTQKRIEFYDEFCTYGRQGNASKQVFEEMIGDDLLPQVPSVQVIRNKIKKLTKFKKWYPKIFNIIGKMSKKNIIIFESFFGRKYSDNPKAIYEYMKNRYPEYKMYWNVNKEYETYFKEHHIPYVIRFSFKGIFKQARAKYWFTNVRRPLWWVKPEGATIIQTWHGTPLKTIGVDVNTGSMPGVDAAKYHSQVTKDSDRWDYAVTPNQYSSDIFRQAFRLNRNQMINSGYPRNDILTNYTQSDIEKIKSNLGLNSDKKIILYAPTWRDNEYVKADYFTANLHLDLDKMKAEFGDDIIVLVRTHYLIANSLDLTNYEKFALNVSEYEDINDLYLISDLLITDYSSVFFDFATLRRPIIFFAYDLDEYANDIRGFYFDYEKDVPGPIVKDTNAVIEEIKKAFETKSVHPNYASFVEKYNAWEDGHATERLVDFVMNERVYEKNETIIDTIEVSIVDGAEVWSEIYGSEGYQFVKNIDARINKQSKVDKTGYLIDPIQKNKVGATLMHITMDDGTTGWIDEQDIIK
ncbi:bifunctional glycosyltransferase/CDP-glycerol:glycerophosphate glycerophosphotransferase [Dellaglioa sp. BT-FLS60]